VIDPHLIKNNGGPAKKITKYIFLSFIFVLLASVVFFGVQWFSNSLGDIFIKKINPSTSLLPASLGASIDNVRAQILESSDPSKDLLPYRNWQVGDLSVDAQSAILVEIGAGKSKVLFNKNEQKKLPIASLAKLMTALVVLENYDLSKSITISQDAMAQEGEQGNLQLGQVFFAKDLLYMTLVESSNRSAYALAEAAGVNNFVTLMNKKALEMGLTSTRFEDSTGLNPGSYSTAMDLVALTQYLFENYPLFKEIISLKQYDLYLPGGVLHHSLINTNELLDRNDVIGGKTGFTKEAKGCLMILSRPPGDDVAMMESGQDSLNQEDYIINIVLGSHDRFKEVENLMNWVRVAYEW